MTDIPTIKFTLPDGTGSIRFYSSQDVRFWADLERGTSTYSINGKYRLQDDQWEPEVYGHVYFSDTTQSGDKRTRRQVLSQRTRLWACDQLEEADVAGMIAAHPEYVAAGGVYEQYTLRLQIVTKVGGLRRQHKHQERLVEDAQRVLDEVQRTAVLRAKALADAERELEEFGTVKVPELAALNY